MLQSLGKDDNLSKVAKTFKEQEARQAQEIIDKEFENDADVPPLPK